MATAVNEKFEQVDRSTWVKNAITLIKADELSANVAENRWKQMVAWTVQSTDLQLPAVESLMEELWTEIQNSVLAEFFNGQRRNDLSAAGKKDFNKKTAWFRSNKSVIKKAIKLGIDMLDDERMPKAKSALELECQEAQRQQRNELTPLQKFMAAINSASSIALNIDEESDRQAARAVTQQLLDILTTRR